MILPSRRWKTTGRVLYAVSLALGKDRPFVDAPGDLLGRGPVLRRPDSAIGNHRVAIERRLPRQAHLPPPPLVSPVEMPWHSFRFHGLLLAG